MLLEVKNLRGGYGKKDVIKGLSFSLDRGEIVSVLGPNGCGKSTLFRLLLGFLPLSGGSVLVNHIPIGNFPENELAKEIAYIPQYHSPVFSYRVLDVVLMGRASHLSAFESPGEKERNLAFLAMERLHILPLANKKYTDLSGGERQLVLIARAICQDARLFIMDEPGSGLDYANQKRFQTIVEELAESGYAILLSTHSPDQPFSMAHKVLLMKEGTAAAFGKPETAITPALLEAVYETPMDLVTVTDRNGKTRTLCLPL